MASQFTVNPLTATTKGEMKRLRQAGFIPISLQHKGMSTLHFQQEAVPLDEFIQRHGDAALINLILQPGGEHERAIVQTVQRNPLTGRLMHVAFQQLRLNEALHTHVQLVFVGEPQAVRDGDGVVQHQQDRIDISCEQNCLPDNITVDVSDMLVGGVLHVSDLPADVRYKILTAPETVLASLKNTRAALAKDVVAPAA